MVNSPLLVQYWKEQFAQKNDPAEDLRRRGVLFAEALIPYQIEHIDLYTNTQLTNRSHNLLNN